MSTPDVEVIINTGPHSGEYAIVTGFDGDMYAIRPLRDDAMWASAKVPRGAFTVLDAGDVSLKLLAALNAAAEDARRLDWLEEPANTQRVWVDASGEDAPVYSANGGCDWSDNIREAIDAAIAASADGEG